MQTADAFLTAGAGLVAGGVNAIAGGGSLLLFPALIAAGYGTLAANVTNSVALWPGYVGGVAGFRAELRGERGRLTRLGIICAVGAAVGCVLLLSTPEGAFDIVVPFLVLLASLLLAVQPRVSKLVGPLREGQTANAKVLYPAVGLASVYGGYFGGALGVILLGTLALTLPENLRKLNGLKAVLQLVVATVTVIAFGIFGPVDWVAVAIIAPATLVGGFAGGHIARRLDDKLLRRIVVVFGVAVAILLFIRALT
ncbi:MAG TPA: sulfite exporter TauE/SafE family protein [Mycobacteriales bacterium]|nr:sulfite exporter TauE/SafE family protein [Mycobacteriales bacterium]